MKKLIVLGLLSVATMFAQDGERSQTAATKQKQAPAKAKKLTRAELDQLLENPNTLLLDVRQAGRGHLHRRVSGVFEHSGSRVGEALE